MDLFPTIAALCGADPLADRVIDGRNIRHLLGGNAPAPPGRLRRKLRQWEFTA